MPKKKESLNQSEAVSTLVQERDVVAKEHFAIALWITRRRDLRFAFVLIQHRLTSLGPVAWNSINANSRSLFLQLKIFSYTKTRKHEPWNWTTFIKIRTYLTFKVAKNNRFKHYQQSFSFCLLLKWAMKSYTDKTKDNQFALLHYKQ